MKCRHCGQENRDKRKYCRKCGKPLGYICPICGFENEENDVFCGGCGRDLNGKAGPAPGGGGGTSSVSEIPQSGTPKIDPARVLHRFEKEETDVAEKGKKEGQPSEESKEIEKKEQPEQVKMSQAEIDQLFEEKAKEGKKEEEKETKVEAASEKKETASRYVDKKSPSVLDAPITQDEIDRLVEEYKKKHK